MANIFGILFFAFAIGVTLGAEDFNKQNDLFALKLYQEIIRKPESRGKNILFSPFSIRTAGASLFGGAEGKTASEITIGLNLDSTSDAATIADTFKSKLKTLSKDPSFTIANKIYLANGFSIAPHFLEVATMNFNSQVENIDFTDGNDAADNINRWFDNKTGGRIKDIVKPTFFDDYTQLLIANGIHFKGEWEHQFDKSQTRRENFYLPPRETIQVDMMYGEIEVKFLEEENYFIFSYPFKNTNGSMYIVQNIDRLLSLDELETKLHEIIVENDYLNYMTKMRRLSLIHLKLPKFKIDFDLDLETYFKNMGMHTVFSQSASFYNMLSHPQHLSLSKAIHKASVEINEDGGPPAVEAVTNELDSRGGTGVKAYTNIELNKPFLYFITGANQEIYFMGRFTGKD